MTGESREFQDGIFGPMNPDRRTFLRGGLSLAGGTVLASVALEMLRDPSPAMGAPPRPPRPKQDRPTCLAVAETDKILTCDDGKRVFLWEPGPGGDFEGTKFAKDHGNKIAYVAVKGNRVLTAGFDGDVVVRALSDTPNVHPDVFDKHKGFAPPRRVPEVWVAAVADDQTMALSADNFGNILYWNSSNQTIVNAFKDGDEWVAGLAFLPPNGGVQKRFLSAHEDGKMLMWDFTTVNPDQRPNTPTFNPAGLARFLFQHGNRKYPVNAVAVTTDATTHIAVSGGFDGNVRLWDVNPANLVAWPGPNPSFKTIPHPDVVWRVAISPNNQKFATASQNGDVGVVRLFRLRDGTEWHDPTGPVAVAGGVMGVGFNGDEEVVYTTGDSRGNNDHFRVWNVPATV